MTYTSRGETYYGILKILIYIGQWENGKKPGEGVYTYKSKDVYSGWWAFG